MRNGDLWIRYKGEAHALTTKGDYTDFAVNSDGSYLALLRTVQLQPSLAHITLLRNSGGDFSSVLTIAVSTTTSLIATCGTLASVENSNALQGRVAISKDLLNRKDFSKSDYVDFRCSPNRQVVVGYKDMQDRELRVLGDPEKKTTLDYLPNLLDLSANGQFAGFYTSYIGSSHLCLWNLGETARCLLNQNVSDRVSVSDSGDMIFATDSGESCLYKDGEHYSITPKPGYDTGDTCPTVAHWHPGMAEAETLESLARHPQWLTDAAASRLASWQQRQF
jgi:hypothetical protein